MDKVKFTFNEKIIEEFRENEGNVAMFSGLPRAAKRSLCRYLIVETTAAHFSLRQQKIMLANRPSPGQPITTNNKKLGSV